MLILSMCNIDGAIWSQRSEKIPEEIAWFSLFELVDHVLHI